MDQSRYRHDYAGQGTTIENGADVYVKGSGVDIWGSSDSFCFVYNTVTGDVEFSAEYIKPDYGPDPMPKAYEHP